jgi:hypothetical protein
MPPFRKSEAGFGRFDGLTAGDPALHSKGTFPANYATRNEPGGLHPIVPVVGPGVDRGGGDGVRLWDLGLKRCSRGNRSKSAGRWPRRPEHALAKQFRRTPSPNPNSISKLLARGAFQSVWDERGRVSPQVFEFGPSRRRTKPGASSHCLIFQPFVISSNRQRSTPAGKPHLRRASLRRMSRQASTGPVVRCRSIALCRSGPDVLALSQFTARTQGPALQPENQWTSVL